MARRLTFATALVALLVGLVAPVRASAEIDEVWDYQALSIGGSYKAVTGQFGGDFATDILFYGPGAAGDSLWIGNAGQKGAASFTKHNFSVGGDYTPVVGDFGGDGYDDILFYGAGSAVDSLWISDDVPGYFNKSRKVSVGGAYEPKVLHDYRVDKKDDILFLGPGAAKDYLWHFADNTSATYSSRPLTVNSPYQLVIGDYTGDFLDDVVLYQQGAGKDYKWVSNSAGAFTQTNLNVGGTYEPVVVYGERFDGIYWWSNGNGRSSYWRSNGPTFSSIALPANAAPGTAISAGLSSVILEIPAGIDGFFVAEPNAERGYYNLSSGDHEQTTAQGLVGDYNDDGFVDVVWYGPGSAKDELWYTAPSTKARSLPTKPKAVKVTPVAPR